MVARRSIVTEVGDEDVCVEDAHTYKCVSEQLATVADEGLTLFFFILSGCLSDKDNVGVTWTNSGDIGRFRH